MCPAQIINSKATLQKTKTILYKGLMTTWKIKTGGLDRHSGAISVNGEGGPDLRNPSKKHLELCDQLDMDGEANRSPRDLHLGF